MLILIILVLILRMVGPRGCEAVLRPALQPPAPSPSRRAASACPVGWSGSSARDGGLGNADGSPHSATAERHSACVLSPKRGRCRPNLVQTGAALTEPGQDVVERAPKLVRAAPDVVEPSPILFEASPLIFRSRPQLGRTQPDGEAQPIPHRNVLVEGKGDSRRARACGAPFGEWDLVGPVDSRVERPWP